MVYFFWSPKNFLIEAKINGEFNFFTLKSTGYFEFENFKKECYGKKLGP